MSPPLIAPGRSVSRRIAVPSVDLPLPDSPSRPMNSPSSMLKVTSRTASRRRRVGAVVHAQVGDLEERHGLYPSRRCGLLSASTPKLMSVREVMSSARQMPGANSQIHWPGRIAPFSAK